MPSLNTIKKALELWQDVTDLQNNDDFKVAMYVYFVNNAGNKKN